LDNQLNRDKINQAKVKYQTSISEHFKNLPDPRKSGMILHKLLDIITISVCAVICGANDWVGVETFAKSKELWLRSFLELPNGIPSHDTLNTVLNTLSAKKFQECFASWMQSLIKLSDGEVVAIDGKRLRHSYDKKSGKAAIHRQ
jgi:predicted transposase YbfD/YdcC